MTLEPDALASDRVADHYRVLLAANLTWMLGDDIESTAADQGALLAALLGEAAGTGPALDLGCGSGAQSLALADRGHDPVVAVDPDPTLLAELARHAAGRPAIRPTAGDAVAVTASLADASVTLAVCMGDSLVHLPSVDAVDALLADLGRVVAPGGAVALTYRDMTAELHGTDRFVPVRSDRDRLLLCFLEASGPDTVEVHDVLQTRSGETWSTIISSYPKLRLAHERVAGRLRDAGLEVTVHQLGPNGMWQTVARRA